ncbi:MAG: hypothetical protein AAF360_04525 [Pseudomonadota bacterium]
MKPGRAFARRGPHMRSVFRPHLGRSAKMLLAALEEVVSASVAEMARCDP